jgi:hypothetical protein
VLSASGNALEAGPRRVRGEDEPAGVDAGADREPRAGAVVQALQMDRGAHAHDAADVRQQRLAAISLKGLSEADSPR